MERTAVVIKVWEKFLRHGAYGHTAQWDKINYHENVDMMFIYTKLWD